MDIEGAEESRRDEAAGEVDNECEHARARGEAAGGREPGEHVPHPAGGDDNRGGHHGPATCVATRPDSEEPSPAKQGDEADE